MGKVKLHSELKLNGKLYKKGSYVSIFKIYPFFLIHVLIFGASGFFLAYFDEETPTLFLFLHGGIAILVYATFYAAIFGVDEVKWMFINAALGLFGIYAEINWLLSFFGKSASDYSVVTHVIPFLYYILYTFLLRQMILDIFDAREDKAKRSKVNQAYVFGSIGLYSMFYVL